MSESVVATRKDIDDVLQVLDTVITRFDERFNRIEQGASEMTNRVGNIDNHLDSIEKRFEIFSDEQSVMSYQLTRLNDWAEKVGDFLRIPSKR